MRRRGVSIALPWAVLVLVAACSPTPSPSSTASPSGSSDPVASAPPVSSPDPSRDPGSSDGPEPSGPPADAARGLVLGEIGFAHGDETAFIELWNAGDEPADLRDLGLAIDGTLLPVGFPVESLGSDARIVLRFDSILGATLDPTVAHGPPAAAPDPAGGTAELLDGFGRPVDAVAWGDEPDAVRTGLGGVEPETLDPAGTIGRAPSASLPFDRLSWVPYPAGEGTPGAANPLPGVPVMLPFSGAVFETTTVDLDWYPAPGATDYRVQIATDPGFGSIVHDAATEDLQVVVDLEPGSYWWRVQAGLEGAIEAPFAGPNTFEVIPATAGVALARFGGATAAGGTAVDPPASKHVAVPLIAQRKDTTLLLLERNVRLGPHPWDDPHGQLDPRDPSDNMNCALASTAMFSAFACPNCRMSQDRIGYELFKGRLPGPERDLNYGDGLTEDEVTRAIEFALLGSQPRKVISDVPDTVWATLKGQIDLGRPVVVGKASATSGHVFLVTGYTVVAGKRTVYVNDPWTGLKTYAIGSGAVANGDEWYMWPTSGPLLGRQQELAVTTDTDEDGIVDFDETERFGTDPDDGDTDEDGVGDKQEVASSVFDAVYGYSTTFQVGTAYPPMTGRDYDADGLAPERDPDSDNGKCRDGDEDEDLDGEWDDDESWNFDAADDPCDPGNGTLTWNSWFMVGSPDSWGRITESLTVTLRLRPDPSDPTRNLLNDGSTYAYQSRSRGYLRGIGGCDTHTDGLRIGSGTLAPDDAGASVMIEYEPGQDGLWVSVYALWRGNSRSWDCFSDQTYPESGAFTSDDFCVGLEDAADGKPERTFVFDCGDDLGVGWGFGYTWRLTGTITLR